MNLEKINALVEKHVMGEMLFAAARGNSAICGGSRVSGGIWVKTGEPDHEWGPRVRYIKEYTTDIAAAWEVVERMEENHLHLYMNHTGAVYRCWFYDDHDTVDPKGYWYTHIPPDRAVWEHAAPLAICLAALKAVGVEVECTTS